MKRCEETKKTERKLKERKKEKEEREEVGGTGKISNQIGSPRYSLSQVETSSRHRFIRKESEDP